MIEYCNETILIKLIISLLLFLQLINKTQKNTKKQTKTHDKKEITIMITICYYCDDYYYSYDGRGDLYEDCCAGNYYDKEN